MFNSERPSTRPVTPGPATPYFRLKRRPSRSALYMWRSFDSRSFALFGRTPCDAANASTWRLNAKVLTDVTTGTPSTSPTHWPQGATESAIT